MCRVGGGRMKLQVGQVVEWWQAHERLMGGMVPGLAMMQRFAPG